MAEFRTKIGKTDKEETSDALLPLQEIQLRRGETPHSLPLVLVV